MSSQDGPDAAAIVQLYSSNFVDNAIEVAAAALLVYEYLVTLNQEIQLFWARRARAASLLFFTIRYWTLLNYVVFWSLDVAAAHFSDEGCVLAMLKIQFASVSLQYIPWAVLSALRVFALSGKRWPLSVLVFVVASVPAITNLVAFNFSLTGVKVFTLGCIEQLDVTPLQHKILSVVTRASLSAADFIVVVVTIFATWNRGLPRMCTTDTWRLSLGDVLLYNGITYFLVLLALNILVIVLGRASSDATVQQASYLTNISAPVSAILICRFLLDLQAANRASAEFGSQMLSLPPNLQGVEEEEESESDTLRFDVGVFGAETRHDSLFTGCWDGGGDTDTDTVRGGEGDEEGRAGGAMVLRPVTSSGDRSRSRTRTGVGGLA
ncbi:uncharacterized protein TRAVEDRAFT_53299 [Trametes versicolor FP-101664 SS1]|uniref:uncharacterized protein n=1 Tax=Trametes versicolor (strain FP-101664) TaxID=717944 RepID=UPI00046245AE|nr:uncharacterized protein TRAVEDRAFT_53299 [Trametes versicolor FP-101664 SS1]EIW52866.1 hypothetical protein TRAVEDRAFT_53299 [Trametes versicolor FP-101664 SS1]